MINQKKYKYLVEIRNGFISVCDVKCLLKLEIYQVGDFFYIRANNGYDNYPSVPCKSLNTCYTESLKKFQDWMNE
jgi:hypothetical protein